MSAATPAAGQADALREAGFILGTAYQLVDDILDSSDDESLSGKTLGKDEERGKTTATTATENAPDNPAEYIDSLLARSSAGLSEWPDLQAAWNDYLDVTMKPVLSKHLSAGYCPAS